MRAALGLHLLELRLLPRREDRHQLLLHVAACASADPSLRSG
jgi:hypothetical protein